MGDRVGMITSTMTEKELIVEVTADYLNAFRYSDHIDRKFRRLVIKSTRFPVMACYEYVSPRKNRWLIFCESRSKKEVLDNSRISLVTIYNTDLACTQSWEPSQTERCIILSILLISFQDIGQGQTLSCQVSH